MSENNVNSNVTQNPPETSESNAIQSSPETTKSSGNQSSLFEEILKNNTYDDYNVKQEVITIGSELASATEFMELRNDITDIAVSLRKGRLLTGKVLAVEVIRDTPVAVVMYDAVKVCIPIEEFTNAELKNSDNNRARTQFLNCCIGAEIDFIVTAVDEESFKSTRPVCLASRLMAMEKKRSYWYNPDIAYRRTIISKYEADQKAGKPTIVEVRVTHIAKQGRGILVECMGIETYIKNPLLSHNYIASAYEVCEVGDVLRAKITKLEILENGECNIELSIKDAQTHPFDAKRHFLNVGMRMDGTVRGANDKVYFVYAPSLGITVICQQVDWQNYRPKMGDRVRFVITGINDSSKRVFGEIKQNVGQRGVNGFRI